MTLIEKIKNSIESSTGCEFLYSASGNVNRLLDYVSEFPCAFAFLIESGRINADSDVYCESANIVIFFVQPTEFDFDAIENETLIEECRNNAYKWLHSVKKDNDLEVLEVIETQRVYDNMDMNLTGFALNVSITETYGFNACAGKPYNDK